MANSGVHIRTEEPFVNWLSEDSLRFPGSYMPCLDRLKGVEVNEEKSPEKTENKTDDKSQRKSKVFCRFLSLCIFKRKKKEREKNRKPKNSIYNEASSFLISTIPVSKEICTLPNYSGTLYLGKEHILFL